MTEIVITSVKALGEPIEIPGLPELLAKCMVPGPRKPTEHLHNYDQKHFRRDGHLVTVLTRKKNI